MSKSLDQLARNLAAGMSRRKAIWQFVGGLGVVAALTGKAQASPAGSSCVDFCDQEAEYFRNLCVEASQSCCHGYCAEITLVSFNGSPKSGVCFNGQTPGGGYTCVPEYR
jgi:hypothetical protein